MVVIFKSMILKHMSWIKFISIYGEITVRVMQQNIFDDLVSIGSGNGLVPSGKKPLLELLLTEIYVLIWAPQAPLSCWKSPKVFFLQLETITDDNNPRDNPTN